MEKAQDIERVVLSTLPAQELEQAQSFVGSLARIQADQEIISEQVASLLEAVLKNADDASPCEETLEGHFLIDLAQDMTDLSSNTSGFNGENIYGLSKASYYPRMAMTGSSVIVFPDRSISDKVATFVSNTSIAYKGTVRDMNMSNSAVTYRINLIGENQSNGSPEVHPIDFSNDMEYWAFVEAVSRAATAQSEDTSFYWSGRGMLHSTESSAAGDIVKFLSGASGNSHIVEITHDKLLILAGQQSTFEMALPDLKALCLTCDWHAPSEYVLEIDMQGTEPGFYAYTGFSLALLDRNLEVLRNPQYHHRLIHHYMNDEDKESVLELTRVLVPLSLENLQDEQTPAGLKSVALLKESAAPSKAPVKGGAAVGGVDDIAALDTIPFSAFKAFAAERHGGQNHTATNLHFTPILQQPTIHDVTIAAAPLDKAVEVHILGAVDLPCTSSGSEPSCYCAVYLVDALGEKINAKGNGVTRIFSSSEEGEWKTDIIKNKTNPMWDTKLVLQGGHDVGIESVASVVIIVKEHFRFSKPKHLGQVTIPIGCFLDGTSVPLTLPLEMSRRTTGNSDSIKGVLHVQTQAVKVKNGDVVSDRDSVATVIKPINRARSGSVFSKPKDDTPDKIPIQYTLKAAGTDALNVFWPFVVLGGGVGASSGYIALGIDGLHISMSPGAGGVLANCDENRSFADRRKTGEAMDGTGNYFSLDWGAIEDVLPLTASVLKLRVVVHKVAMHAKKGASKQHDTPQGASVSLLVAPCPSKALQQGVHERQMIQATRAEAQRFKELVLAYRSNIITLRGKQDVIVAARMLVAKLEDSVARHSFYDGWKSLQQAHVSIEEVATTFSVANRWKGREERDRNGVKRSSTEKNTAGTILAAKEVQSIVTPVIFDEHDKAIVATRTKIRAQMYRIKLIDICKGLTGEHDNGRVRRSSFSVAKNDKGLDIYAVPVYSSVGVQQVLKHDKEKILTNAGYFSAVLATELFELHSMIIKCARERILDYILCSADAENEFLLKDCLRELIEGYFTLMRQEFEVYLGSPAAFKRTPGQEAKIMLLQMVVFCDDALDSLVRKNLWCANAKLSTCLSLLNPQFKPPDVVQWYASSLQAETAQWLSKTIKQAAMSKNNPSLPWDYDENGSHVISSLPETVLKQNNSFLELCDRTATKFAFATASVYPKKYQSGDEYESEIDRLRVTISFEMVESSNRCLLLLAEEYQNALQTKNWSKPQHQRTSVYNLSDIKSVQEEKNFMFLLSIANDCGRIIDIATSNIEADPIGSNAESARKVVKRFKRTADLVVIEIYRSIFADVHDLIIDFRNEWENQANLVVKKLLHNCTSYFEYTGRKLMHKSYHESIVGYCGNVITGCFLLLIKSRAGEDKKFDRGEFDRFRSDIADMNTKFGRSLGHNPDHDPAIMPVSILEDFIQIIGTPHASKGKKLSPAEELEQARSPLAKIMSAVTFAYSRQVSDGVLKDAVYMRPDVGAEIVQLLSGALRSLSADLRFKNFSLVDKDLLPHENAFHNMCEKIYDKNAAPGTKADVNFFKSLRVGLSNAFTVNEQEQKIKERNSRLLKILELEDIDEDERLEAAKKRRDAALYEENSLSGSDKQITLAISRIEVRGIISSSFFSAANPYVAINVDTQRVKTSVQWGAKGGTANFTGDVLTVTHSKNLLSTGVMEIEVNDKERLRRKRYIGKVEIKLGGLDLHRIESWFALKGGEHDGAEVFVCVDMVNRDPTV